MANLLELAGYVQQQGERGRQLGQSQRLGELASQAYTAPQEQQASLLAGMAKISPEFAQQQQAQMQEQGDRRRGRLAGAAKYLLSAFERGDQAAIQGAYRTVRPEFEAMANGKQLPDQVDDTILPMLHQVIAAAGGEQMGGSLVRRTVIGKDGQYYNVMSDGQVVGTGVMANPNIKVMEQPGTVPFGVVTSDGVAGSIVPLGGGQPSQPAQSQRAPGEVPFSIDPSLPPQVQQAIRSHPDAGSAQGITSLPQIGGQPVGPVRIPTAGEIEAQKQAAQLAALPQREAIQTQGALERARGEAQIAANTPSASQRFEMQQKQQKERKLLDATTADLQSTIQIIDQILADREDFGGVTGMGRIGAMIPGTDWADLDAKMETLRARSAFGTLQEMRANSPTGGALGSVTERELGLLQSAETQLANKQSPEALEQALRNYKQSLQESIRRMNSGLQDFYGQPASQPPSGGWSIEVVD